MQKCTQRGPESLLRTAHVLLSSGGDMLQGTVLSSHWSISPSTSEVLTQERSISPVLGLQGHLGSLAEAGVAGGALLACRRSALVEGLSHQIKEL